MTYYYTDQNNNRYHITSSEVSYDPIKASESSSGHYDGGEKGAAQITSEAFQKISKMAEALMQNSESISSGRKKGTSILSVTKNSETKRGIILASNERKSFEEFLQNLIK